MSLFPVSRLPARRVLFCTTALFLAQAAMAADVTVSPGTTLPTTWISGGDTLTVEEGGTIDGTAAGDRGVRAEGDNYTIINYGTIRGGNFYGSNDDGVEIWNSSNSTITNASTGLIEGAEYGVHVHDSSFITVNNAGTILGMQYDEGLRIDGSDNITVNNTGKIIGGPSDDDAIRIDESSNVTVNNDGLIDGWDDDGFDIDDSQYVTINNNNSIIGREVGITVGNSDNFELNNRGLIVGGDWAIFIGGTGKATVNLLAGSVIDGDVVFGYLGADVTVNIGEGLNLYLDYDQTLGTIGTLNSVFPIIHDETNGIVYTIDPSTFELSQAFIQTTADAVHAAVRDGAGRGNRFGGGFSGTGTFAYGTGKPGFDNTGPRGWVSGFGGYQSQGAKQAYGGLVTGGGFASGDRMYGAFLGGSYSQLKDTITTDASSFYGGIYGGMSAGPFWIEAAFLGGHTDFSYERTVANNMVAGGLETVSADYDGTFISPSLTIGRSLGDRLELRVGGTYAGLFIDGYTESGMAGMTVASRDVHVAAVRAEARYLAEQRKLHNGIMSVETWAGVDGFFNLGGDDVEISIAGLPFEAIPVNVTDATVVGFAGIGLNHDYGKWSLRTSVEGRYGTDAFTEIRGSAAAAMKF
ncbi:autotransporter outer membrane beta-barrel domain-containing protein [Nitratireductor sp. XY-223]|uniref:autotransporter outer membrane beta-barrel domain-containing protein n=1 Tax=Nitratireductor sp. XY-223 TaxID=2561926 RepID=UPI0010AA69C2|nr:autotransporter outer membrane beta-barrel domain-containing protein [Nitratireductor sp. XY-223]